MGFWGRLIGAAAAEAAEKIAEADRAAPPDPWRWTKRGIALAILILGWLFILWANRFHITAPTIFLCIGFLAVELTVISLFRTGAEMAAPDEEIDDSTWGRPLGARAELEREKKTLLKAIKEAEFDREMGKLSKADADEMIGLYRARAIEVIKEIDKLDGGAGTVREQIEREVKARLELEAKSKAVVEKAGAMKAGKNKKKAAAAAAKDAPKQAEAKDAPAEAKEAEPAPDASGAADEAAPPAPESTEPATKEASP